MEGHAPARPVPGVHHTHPRNTAPRSGALHSGIEGDVRGQLARDCAVRANWSISFTDSSGRTRCNARSRPVSTPASALSVPEPASPAGGEGQILQASRRRRTAPDTGSVASSALRQVSHATRAVTGVAIHARSSSIHGRRHRVQPSSCGSNPARPSSWSSKPRRNAVVAGPQLELGQRLARAARRGRATGSLLDRQRSASSAR